MKPQHHKEPLQRTGTCLMMTMETCGLTLIELLIEAGALALVTGAVMLMFTSGHDSFLSANAYLHVQQEARRALEAMSTELRTANNLDTELTDAEEDTPAGGATRLNFQISRGYDVNGCTADAVCWGNDTGNDGWVHYLVSNAQLFRCQSSGPPDTNITDVSACRVLANDAQSFLVDYTSGTRTVTLRLQVRNTSTLLPGGAMDTGTLRVQTRLRNPS